MNEDVSGLLVSSTTNALPVPVWVILTKSSLVDADAIIEPFTLNKEPSNVKFVSTVPLGDVPSKVITPLLVVPVKDNKPEVPDVPIDPLLPDVPVLPDVPIVPDVPVDPLVPALPDVPLDPEVPIDPLVPLIPDVPDVPVDPDVPLTPEDPEDPLTADINAAEYQVPDPDELPFNKFLVEPLP